MKEKTWFITSDNLKKIYYKGDTTMRFSEKLVKKLLQKYTKRGDKVLDPFAGFGTTITTAQKIGRIGWGIEYDKKRYEFIKNKIISPNYIIHDDAININKYVLPKFDCLITSPPYMREFDKENPLINYTKKGNYLTYLKKISKIFKKIKKIMKRKATIIVEVSNTFEKGKPMTPLAWDVGREIAKIFFLEKEMIRCTKNKRIKSNNSDHSYCLIFKNK